MFWSELLSSGYVDDFERDCAEGLVKKILYGIDARFAGGYGPPYRRYLTSRTGSLLQAIWDMRLTRDGHSYRAEIDSPYAKTHEYGASIPVPFGKLPGIMKAIRLWYQKWGGYDSSAVAPEDGFITIRPRPFLGPVVEDIHDELKDEVRAKAEEWFTRVTHKRRAVRFVLGDLRYSATSEII